MGTGGRTSQMVFLRNYYVLIHCERAGWLLPLFPSYWEVTVELYEGEGMYEKQRGGKEAGGWCERWRYIRVYAPNVRSQAVSVPGSWGEMGAGAQDAEDESRCSLGLGRSAAHSTLSHLLLWRWDLKNTVNKALVTFIFIIFLSLYVTFQR